MNYSFYVESTPNPEVMKFVSNKILTEGNIEILNVKDSQDIPIAKELFNFPFVKSIFLSQNFISVTKINNVKWDDIAMQLRIFLVDFLNKSDEWDDQKPIKKNTVPENISNKSHFEGDSQKIENILEEYIKPAVESDGGSITLNSFENGIVTVNLSGACSGCPSSSLTLKQGIESLLKQKLGDKVKEVIAKEC